MSAAERLKKVRLARGYMTARAAAEAIGVSVATYMQHEGGQRGYPAPRAAKYAAALGTTPEFLLYGTEPRAFSLTDSVPIVGEIITGGMVEHYSTNDPRRLMVEVPTGLGDVTQALLIQGDALGPLTKDWLVFTGPMQDPIPEECMGRLTLCHNTELWLIGIPAHAGPGRYHVIGANAQAHFELKLSSAAKVWAMRPQ